MFVICVLLAGQLFESKMYGAATLASLQYTDKLQFTGQEEGRIRTLYDNGASPNAITGFAYDYFIKDHLGNVRMPARLNRRGVDG